MLAGDDRDALGRTGLLAHVARDALERPVLARLQDVLAAEAARVVALLLRIENRRKVAECVSCAADGGRDRHASQDLREVEPLQESQLLRRLGANVDDAAHRSSSPAMMFKVPSVAIMSETVPPRMIFSNAAMFGKHGGRTFRRYGPPPPVGDRRRSRARRWLPRSTRTARRAARGCLPSTSLKW